MLLMAEKAVKANNKYMKNYDQDKESYIQYLDANNLYGWAMSQKLPVNGFKGQESYLNLKKSLEKIMMKTVIRDIFLK